MLPITAYIATRHVWVRLIQVWLDNFSALFLPAIFVAVSPPIGVISDHLRHSLPAAIRTPWSKPLYTS